MISDIDMDASKKKNFVINKLDCDFSERMETLSRMGFSIANHLRIMFFYDNDTPNGVMYE